MKEILLIRHGETEYNKAGKFGGSSSDVCLNARGQEQVLSLKKMLSGEEIAKIYSSDMKRCIETGAAIEGPDLITCDSLREMDFGRWEGLTYKEIKERYREELEVWEKDWTGYRITGGESFGDMAGRVLKKFDEILALPGNMEEKIAVITHGGCIRAILGHYITGSIKDAWRFYIENAAVSRLCMNGDYCYLKSLNENRV